MKYPKRILAYCLLLLFCSMQSAFAQSSFKVSGVITDKESGYPLIGATVMVDGTQQGVSTGIDGRYEISGLHSGDVLVYSYVGMKSSRHQVLASGTINIALETDAMGLEQVVVVGYGSVRKRDLTGSIVSVKGEELKTSPDYNPIRGLQGKVPGLSIINTGVAGGSPTVRLRGVATINAGTNPLYVVDGMLVDNIDFISPTDILSIEVLKDPSSLSIFGVQGANGVIIISTSRAKEGQTSVSYDGYAGVQVVHDRDRVNMANATEFTQLYNELLKNQATKEVPYTPYVPELLGKGTEWVERVLRPAVITNHNATVAHSSEKAQHVFSTGYFLQDGVQKYERYSRINLRYAGDWQVAKAVKIGSSMNLSRWDKKGSSVNMESVVRAAPTYKPYAPAEAHSPENPGSHYNPAPDFQREISNPVAQMEINRNNSKSHGYRAVGNAYIDIKLFKELQFKATGYADIGVSTDRNISPRYFVGKTMESAIQKNAQNSMSRGTAEYRKFQADFLFSYKKTIREKHRVDATVGYTAYLNESEGFNASADSIAGSNVLMVPGDMWMLSQGNAQTKKNGDWFNSESFISYLGRIMYSYDNKYLLTATFRVDGSSKFSPRHRWGYFPSVGAGWVLSEESFLQNTSQVDFLKLRASWGRLGNDKIGNYMWLETINPTGQQVIIDGKIYYIPTRSSEVDENLHWEVMEGYDVGIEGKFFKNRLSVDLGHYTKKTSDLLAYVAPSVSIGAGYAITNAGAIRNSGFEFILSWQDQVGDFSYGVSVNGSTLKNRVLELGNNNSDIITGDKHRTSVGHPVGSFYGYVQNGIFQNQAEIDAYTEKYNVAWQIRPGDIRYTDLDRNNRIDDKDRKFIGSPLPTFMYGINLNFGWKGLDLSVDFNGVSGNKILNAKYLPGFTQFNFYQAQTKRWHGEGTSNKMPILDNTREVNRLISTNMIEDGSYCRIRNIQIGYTFPKQLTSWMHISKLRVYINAQNPLTIRSNTGFTPEIGGGILDGGVDYGTTYPLPSTYTAGISLNF